jgi:hypothetical protein
MSGFKYGEQQGPVVIAKNQAVVEFLGGYMNVTHGVDLEPIDIPLIITEDAQVSIRLIERAAEIFGPPDWNFRHRNISWETRNGETRELSTRDDAIIHRDSVARNGPGWAGAMVPLYSSMIDPAVYPDNTAPGIEVAASTKGGVSSGATLMAIVQDDGAIPMEPSVHWRKAGGPGAAYFENAASALTSVTVSRPGTYSFIATSSDGLEKVDSAPVEVEFIPESQTIRFARDAMQRLTDIPPRDGKADNALSSIFLYAGDFSVSGNTPEQEIRLHMEAGINQWTGYGDEIAEATLILTPKSLSTPPALNLLQTSEMDFGLVSAADFEADGEIVATIEPDSLQVGVPLEIDVTAALTSALAEGRSGFGLQMRAANGPNDDGVSNFAEFQAVSSASPERDPRLVVKVDERNDVFLADEVAWLADGNGYHPVTGFVFDSGNGWWYSYSLGRYISPFSASQSSSANLYVEALGWCWTSKSTWPYLYQWSTGTWYLALLNSPDYWFFNLASGQWEQIPPQ